MPQEFLPRYSQEMKPAILLIGTNGQVGRELKKMLPRMGEVTALDRQQLDISKPEEIRSAIRMFRPAFIVNAAAYTAVDKAESEASPGARDQRRGSRRDGRGSRENRRVIRPLFHRLRV